MKEYGGYIEFETFYGKMLHENSIALNCGRNAIAYICETKKIKKLYIPYFICSSVIDLCDKIGVLYDFYHINEKFEPIFNEKLHENEWIYIINFYGQLRNEYLKMWKQNYDRIIIDNAQSYYQMPIPNTETIYTCRKYFGVADGAFLYTDEHLGKPIPQDESFERMHFLLGRYERNANEFYSEYVRNNKLFLNEDIKTMSKLTQNLLHGISYEMIAKKRQENFDYLDKKLKYLNQLELRSVYGAFMYPLLIENGREIRKKLQEKKIYIPMLWPNVLEKCSKDSLEYHYAADILPLPIDQRYRKNDMEYIMEEILNENKQ